ncbi:patatin-like phospholipase family protein [Kordia sp.]|uniref:patatin-like phospholipase family protein n=1 Tax=Kordia sp. TaxID=1965332 RepID=UPI0025B9AB45|nr:patatin-like phospholipase family protein [Kordia sp.]MCH2196466.1 patatin-like phospholipase family protein [Kordia sp.]
MKDFIPFKNIGLCFSGGGYRATFFALGVVSYYDKIHYQGKPLLDHIEAISTVSGGTLFGVAFSKASLQKDFDFKAFFNEFYDNFKPGNDQLLETAIAKLDDDQVWKDNPHKKRSLINSFALTYADMDVYKGSFDMFLDKEKLYNLKYVCFNSTEFSFGLAFRFQNTGLLANKPLSNKLLNPLESQLQLGDITASSSCFPLGFEPLVFPDDYISDQKSEAYKEVKKLDRFANGVGIMDGGIADNQGIGSMMNISIARKRDDELNKELDLIVVNDVGSFKMDPWQPEEKKKDESASIKSVVSNIMDYFKIKPLYLIILVLGILLIVLNAMKVFGENALPSLYVVGGIITGIGLLLTVFGYFANKYKNLGINFAKSLFNKNVPAPLVDDVLSFKKLSVGLVQRMLTERISSTVIMVNDIFLKQIRRLNYRLLYSDPDLRHRIITSTVYELNGEKTAYSKSFSFNKNVSPAPSDALKHTGLIASEMPTTLWWDENDIKNNRMDSLIACGQFTSCYKLMDYILKLKKNKKIKLSEEETTAIDALYTDLENDWKQFNTNPMFYIESLKS